MISICIPTYNRYLMTIQCFEQVLHDDRVSEVVISDDASTDGSYDLLSNHFKYENKVKLFRNSSNIDCYYNKRKAVELASNSWVILADSDNIFGVDYLDRIFDSAWYNDILFTPSWAAPHFDFRDYSGLLITSENVAEWVDKPMFETMLNAANFFVNRQQYLDTWTNELDPITSDSIWFAYNWLKKGNGIYVAEDLTYTHRVHSGSHYQNNCNRTPDGFHNSVLNKLRELK